MAEAEDLDELCSKRKAITALLPYAVWQERDGQPEMLDTLLHAARASRVLWFRWYHISEFASTLFSKATSYAIVLTSPYIPWGHLGGRGNLVQQWAEATSRVPYTQEVAQDVVDVLLHIASQDALSPYIPIDVWSWLKKQPALPPICLGRYIGTDSDVIKVVWGLKDIEVIKSYLLLTWSEWDTFDGFKEVCASMGDNFGGVGGGCHRADLVQRLDYILVQLDQGLEHLNQHNPNISGRSLQVMKDQYQKLRETLLEMSTEAIAREFHLMITLPCILTLVGTLRIPCNIHVCPSSPMLIASHLEPPPTHTHISLALGYLHISMHLTTPSPFSPC